jgi:hypothetical protein
MSMHFKTIKLILISLIMILLFTACGFALPEAPTSIVELKKSVLVLTDPTMDVKTQDIIKKTLNQWKQTNLIAYEWIQHVNVVDNLLIQKINRTPYSYIIVLGNALQPTGLAAAAKVQDKRWIMLSNGLNPKLGTVPPPDNVSLYLIKPIDPAEQWASWVNQQFTLGASILWVTRTNEPIPTQWAPSEEADHILFIDQFLDPAWFNQLSFQVRSIKPNWIVLYTALESATVQRISSLGIPIVDFRATSTFTWNWDAVLAEQLAVIHSNRFDKGIRYYNPQQVNINQL